MTKALLEPIIINQKSEKLIKKAFSKHNLNKVQKFNSEKRESLKSVNKRKLSVNDIFN